MVQIIAGRKGKGKTKYLLDMANTAVKEAKGSVVYLDKSSKHMYELNLLDLFVVLSARITIWSRCILTAS